MRRILVVSLTVFSLTMGAFLSLQTDADAFPASPRLVTLYVREKADGSPATTGFVPSALATPGKVSIIAPSGTNPCVRNDAVNSGCAAAVNIGFAPVTSEFQLMGDLAVTLYVSTNSPVPQHFKGLSVALVRQVGTAAPAILNTFGVTSSGNVSTTDPHGFTRDSSSSQTLGLWTQIGSTPIRFTLGVTRYSPITIKPGESLGLQFSSVRTTASTPGTADIFVHYGAKMQSGIVMQALGAPPEATGTKTLGVYLDENKITFDPPTGLTAKKRAVGSSASPNNPTEIVWGTLPLDEDVTIAGHGLFGITVVPVWGGTANVEPRMALDVRLTIGTTLYTGMTPYGASTGVQTATPTPVRFVSSLPVADVVVPAGTPIKLGIRLYAVTAGGDYEILYGSYVRPSGVLLPVVAAGGGDAPPAATTTTTAESTTTSAAATTTTTSVSPTQTTTPAPTTTTAAAPPPTTAPTTTTNATAAAAAGAQAKNISEPEVVPVLPLTLPLALLVAILIRRRVRH